MISTSKILRQHVGRKLVSDNNWPVHITARRPDEVVDDTIQWWPSLLSARTWSGMAEATRICASNFSSHVTLLR